MAYNLVNYAGTASTSGIMGQPSHCWPISYCPDCFWGIQQGSLYSALVLNPLSPGLLVLIFPCAGDLGRFGRFYPKLEKKLRNDHNKYFSHDVERKHIR